MSFNVEIEGGKSVRLPTAGKYCDRDIVVTATGGDGTDGVLPCIQVNPTKDMKITDFDRLHIECLHATTIGESAFEGCKSISEIKLPKVTYISARAFFDADLKSIDAPEVETVGERAFQECANLVSVNLPKVKTIGENAFADCFKLSRINLPNVTNIQDFAFDDCRFLSSIDIPKVASIGEYAFRNIEFLLTIDLPVATSIGNQAFCECHNLSTIILRNTETVCQIIVTAVLDTKIVTAEGVPTGEGFIYVPTALYEGYVELIAYQAAQLVGDAATAEYIARAVLRKIEDYPEICG